MPQPRSVKTDAGGRYEVTGLPPGRYVVAASKTNYLTTSFGATKVMGPGKGFDLAAGQSADQVNFSLPHSGVIAGRVVDDFGEPVADAQVMTMRYQYVNGERRMIPAPGRAMTHDIGEFRAFGLPPGDYFVAAVFRTFMAGDSGQQVTYAPTYYPGTGSPSEAERITVGAGQTIGNITLPLLQGRPIHDRRPAAGRLLRRRARPSRSGENRRRGLHEWAAKQREELLVDRGRDEANRLEAIERLVMSRSDQNMPRRHGGVCHSSALVP